MPSVATTVNEDTGPQNLAQLLGVTHTDLAHVLGCHKSTVGRKLTGDSPWRLGELYLISEYYDVPVSKLLGDGPDGAGSSPRERAGSTPFKPQQSGKQTVGLDGPADLAPSTGVRRRQTSAGPARRPKQPTKPDLNGKGKRSKKST